jgi:cation diffusion facilitator family transporter
VLTSLSKDSSAEKQAAAGSSVLAAVGLTGLKIVVGLSTGSLGILAEAAHSGLDLVAAVMTWLAVRFSDRPADGNHLYGHGKVENLSALFETLLLLVTCVWIIYEATHRLLYHSLNLEVNVWSFAVMIISIGVDVSRSRMLYRAAKAHNSQALEADALHFSTDIWSSAVVLLGLFCVKAGECVPGWIFLRKADAVAAIFVALIVVWVSMRLGIQTVQALLDVAPSGMEKRITSAVQALAGVTDCHNVRLRYSGPRLFVDIHVLVNGNQTLNEAHLLTEEIESTIQKIVPNADVTVHPEPDQDGVLTERDEPRAMPSPRI